MTKRRFSGWVIMTVGALALSVAAGCGSAQSGSRLRSDDYLRSLTAGGRPVVTGGVVAVSPGQPADATAYIFNPSRLPATIISATLVKVAGYLAGQLSHVAVDANRNYIGAGRGWPPGVAILPLGSARIPHGQSGIVFGITGELIGRHYVAAGLRITYRSAGNHVGTFIAWSSIVACVMKPGVIHLSHSCTKTGQRAETATERMAG
jgi:hypothetical protein